jgi:hypothetical protein
MLSFLNVNFESSQNAGVQRRDELRRCRGRIREGYFIAAPRNWPTLAESADDGRPAAKSAGFDLQLRHRIPARRSPNLAKSIGCQLN